MSKDVSVGYKLTEVGVIPEDWEVKQLENIAMLERGKFTARPRNDPKYYGGSIPFIQTGDVSNSNGEISNYSQTLNLEGLKVSKLFQKGTLFFTIAANIGDVGFTSFDTACPDSLVAITAYAGINRTWLFYELGSRKKVFEGLATQNAQLNINLEKLRPYQIPIPPLPEQEAIALVLSDTDALITSLDKLIAKKRDIKQAAMQQLLTGKQRLEGFGDRSIGRFKQTEVGMIPDDWDIITLRDVIDYTKGFAFQSKDYQIDGVRIIRVSDTNSESIGDENPICIDIHKALSYGKWSLKEYDLVFSTVGSKPPMYSSMVGKVIMINKTYEGSLLNQNAVLVRSKDRSICKQIIFLNNCKSKRYLRHIETIFRGNANQASLTLHDLFQFQIALPSDQEEQQAIAKVLSDMDSEISALEQRREKTKALKQAMMQELLTGKIRLL